LQALHEKGGQTEKTGSRGYEEVLLQGETLRLFPNELKSAKGLSQALPIDMKKRTS